MGILMTWDLLCSSWTQGITRKIELSYRVQYISLFEYIDLKNENMFKLS